VVTGDPQLDISDGEAGKLEELADGDRGLAVGSRVSWGLVGKVNDLLSVDIDT
jgi:hypothetical protein